MGVIDCKNNEVVFYTTTSEVVDSLCEGEPVSDNMHVVRAYIIPANPRQSHHAGIAYIRCKLHPNHRTENNTTALEFEVCLNPCTQRC